MVRRVAEEDAGSRPRAELVRCCGAEVGEAQAPEHAKLVVSWRCAEEQVVWRDSPSGATRTPIQQVRGRVEGLCPERRRGAAVDQQSSQTIVNRAQDSLGFAVLLGGIRTGEA
jgi:hypothetical protein